MFKGRAFGNYQLELLCFLCPYHFSQASCMLLEPRTLYLGGTDPFVLTSRDAPATPYCAFNGLGVELGAAPGRSLVSLTEGWGYKGLPWNTQIPELRQRLSGSYPLEGQFVGEKKKSLSRLGQGDKYRFLHRIMSYLLLFQHQPSVPSLLPGTLMVSWPSAEAQGTPNCSTAAN